MTRNDYYINRKEKLMSQFKKLTEGNRNVFVFNFSEPETKSIITETMQEYEKLIPLIPYIGGEKNFLTRNLVGSAQLLSLIRVLEKRGLSEYEIGKILYDVYDSHLTSLPGILKYLLGKIYLTRFWQNKMKKRALRSQQRNYPDDWVFEYVPGNGDYTFGINHYECGIHKFYRNMGAEKYVPYLCLLDYPMFRMLNVSLVRTETLGNGGSRCDFRFNRNGALPEGWPPENIEEFKSWKR